MLSDVRSQFFKLKLYRVLNIHGYNLNKQFFLQENVVTLLFYQNRKVNSITTDCRPINTDTSLFQAGPGWSNGLRPSHHTLCLEILPKVWLQGRAPVTLFWDGALLFCCIKAVNRTLSVLSPRTSIHTDCRCCTDLMW